MKKLLLLIPIALLLTACGGSQENPITNGVSSEETYLVAVRADGGWIAQDMTDDELLELGYATCKVFDSGVTLNELASNISTWGTPDEYEQFMAVQIVAAKALLCD